MDCLKTSTLDPLERDLVTFKDDDIGGLPLLPHRFPCLEAKTVDPTMILPPGN